MNVTREHRPLADASEAPVRKRVATPFLKGSCLRTSFVTVCVFLCACDPAPAPRKSATPAKVEAASADVKITQFYARDAVLTEGEKTVLCYGTANAKSARIEPHVGGVGPTLTRCVEVQPKHNTNYTLTAEGPDGRKVDQTVTVQVAADQAALPKITNFAIASCARDYEGQPVFSLVFSDQNAEEISIDPPAFPKLHGSIGGQFGVKPAQTTTYTLSAKGKFGHVAQKQLTVDVTKCK